MAWFNDATNDTLSFVSVLDRLYHSQLIVKILMFFFFWISFTFLKYMPNLNVFDIYNFDNFFFSIDTIIFVIYFRYVNQF